MAYSIKRLAIGCDHAGYRYKEKIKEYLSANGVEVIDFGTDSEDSCDYPVFCRPPAEAVASGKAEAGIVLGGSGNGEAMVANKVKGIRCAVCWDIESARLAKEHNNANMISLGQRMIPETLVLKVVDSWLNSEFEGGRHIRRINMIETG